MAGPPVPGQAQPASVVLAQAIRDEVVRIPGVLALSPGRHYVEATYGPGVTVLGIGLSVLDDRIEADVHVVAAVVRLPVLALQVRAAARLAIYHTSALPPGPVNVYIDDIVFQETPSRETPLL